MEELLNKLIQRGWKPFGWDDKLSSLYKEYGVGKWYIRFHDGMDSELFDLRQLTSKESKLWQFVCKNGMYKKNAGSIYFNDERAKNVFYKIDQFDEEGEVIQTGDMEGDIFIHISEPEYRLIESALCDEDKLEQFLLDNIKVEGNLILNEKQEKI